MKIILILLRALTLLLVSNTLMANPLSSEVDRTKLNENETLKLTIRYQDASISEDPDLRGLDTNFEIIGSSENSSFQFINGSKTSVKEWHYTLLPKKAGKLFIPSFKVNGFFSDAIVIDVSPETLNNSQKKNRDLYIEAYTDKNEAFIQEMITLTIRINVSSNINASKPELTELSLPDFIVKKISETIFQRQQNGQKFHVLEYQYALFPSKSGAYTIPKQRYQIAQTINTRRRSLFNIPGVNDTRVRFLITPEIELAIKPQPNNISVNNWLPATGVTLEDNLQDQLEIEAGTAFTRSITIRVNNNIASAIPPLPELTLQHLKVYPELPALENTKTGNDLISLRTENMAIIPVQPGNYQLPEIRVQWWDTKNQQPRTAVLPAKTIRVSPAANQQATGPVPSPLMAKQQNLPDNSGSLATGGRTTSHFSSSNVSTLWIYSTGFFAALWLITVLCFIKKQYSDRQKKLPDQKTEVRESGQQAFKKLQRACQQQNPAQARQALIDWSQIFYDDESLTTLQAVASRSKSPELAAALSDLDKVIYRDSTDCWDGSKVIDSIKKINQTDNKNPAAQLKPLYPVME